MSEWMGEVLKVNERDWGTKKIYSWQFKGTNMWFRTEETSGADIEVGLCYTVRGESANKITSMAVTAAEDVKAAAQSERAEAGGIPPASSPDYWRWKQMTDIEQREIYEIRAARADATRIVCAALAQPDLLTLGPTKGKRMDILIGMIKETTTQLMEK